MGQGGSSYWNGVGHGALGLVGMGDAYDPMGDARKQLSEAQSKYQAQFNANCMAQLKNMQDLMDVMQDDEKAALQNFNSHVQYVNQEIWNEIKTDELFLKILGVCVLLLFIFRLLEKRCC